MFPFIVNIISFLFCRKFLISAGLLEKRVLPSYFASRLYIHLGISLMPGILILNAFPVNHYLLKSLNPETFRIGAYFIAYSIFFYGLSLWALKTFEERITPNKRINNIRSWVKKPVKIYRNESRNNLFYLFIISLYLVYLFQFIGFIPLLKIISLENLTITRVEISESFKGIKFIKEVFQILTVVISYKCYINYKKSRSKNTLFQFLYSVLLVVLFLTHKFEKAPLLFYALGFLFLNYYLGYKIRIKHLIITTLLLFSFLLALYISAISNYTSLGIHIFTSGPLGRILIGPSMGYYLSLEAFPTYYEHLGLSSISNSISGILNLDHSERSARLLQYIYNKPGVRYGTAGVINGYYLGEAWANFGIVGIILSPMIVACATYLSYRLIISLGRTPLAISILTTFSLSTPIHGGFNDYFYSLLFLFFITVLFARLILKYHKKC